VTRWDEKEEQQSSSISNALLMIIGVFALGFVVGAIWGYMFADVSQTTPIPSAFGELTVILNSDTFIKP